MVLQLTYLNELVRTPRIRVEFYDPSLCQESNFDRMNASLATKHTFDCLHETTELSVQRNDYLKAD